MYFRLTKHGTGQTLTFIDSQGDSHLVDSEHPNFEDVRDGILNDTITEAQARDLIRPVKVVADRLTSLSDRVSHEGSTLFFDGDPIHSALANHILRMVKDNKVRSWRSLVNFLEKVQTNPNEHSRENLYDWLNGRDFTLTSDGDILAYKGVMIDNEGNNVSVFSGVAFVDGVRHEGNIPNPVGSIVEMPRSEVQHDPAVGCSVGLHAGTYEYASAWSRGALLTVKINPRDVVSVPTDSGAQKIRVTRYEILDVTEVKYTEPTYYEEDEYDEDEEETFAEYYEGALDLDDDLMFEPEPEYEFHVGDTVYVTAPENLLDSATLATFCPDLGASGTVIDVDNADGSLAVEFDSIGYRAWVFQDSVSLEAPEVEEEDVPDVESSGGISVGDVVVVTTIYPTFLLDGRPVLSSNLDVGDGGPVLRIQDNGDLVINKDGALTPISPECVMLSSDLDEYGTEPFPGL